MHGTCRVVTVSAFRPAGAGFAKVAARDTCGRSLRDNERMTLTELKYIVALAREKHFGRAADACFVSQPTLSVSIKKLEEELDCKLFERSANEVSVTPLGEEIVRQAQAVLEQAANIREIAKRGKDPLAGALKLGVIYTIGPYLLPDLVRQVITHTPQMPLMLQENFTARLIEMLRTGEIDCAILAEPFPETGFATAALYDEPFMIAVPSTHLLSLRDSVSAQELKSETMLLLGTGHCFRDHVLEVCPEFARFSSDAEGIRKSFEGSSLETIKHMVAAGMGITVVPRLSVPADALAAQQAASAAAFKTSDPKSSGKTTTHPDVGVVRYIPFDVSKGEAPPTRRVVLAWRKSFTRYEAIAALRNAIYACELPGIKRLT
jgi:LysR family transcriptional regulator, hydrogen peroxide-inducible genes activator